jgi:hypothetical protein
MRSALDILLPSQPFDPRAVDESFAAERQAARTAGLTTYLLDSDALDGRRFNAAIRQLPSSDPPRVAMYRGWMLDASRYGDLFDALLARGTKLINNPAQYRHAHHLPEAYSAIEGHTPKTVWTSTGARFDLSTIMKLLEVFGDTPIIVKDYVKSQKHYWAEACFIPSARDGESVKRVVSRFIELQDGVLTGGLVFRAFVELEPLTTHSKSGMPLTKEFRIFFLDGQPLAVSEYWDQGEYGADKPPVEKFTQLAATIDSRFFTMDVARTKAGGWIVMELGDGQVAGLPPGLSPAVFYAAAAQHASNVVP